MGLYERWTSLDESKIPVHAFGAGLSELARGSITKSQLETAFALTAEDITELDSIIATYTGLSTDLEKSEFVAKLEDVMVLCETGFYAKAKAKTELGF